MKAIIVPGVTDLNKGDQALVWESVRLVFDTKLFEEVLVLTSGDSSEELYNLCSQSQKHGLKFLTHILKHPRRGKHKKSDSVNESLFSLLKVSCYGLKDFVSMSFLLRICESLKLVEYFFSSEIFKSISLFHEADVVFVKGGGFLHAYGEKRAPYVIWYLLFYIKLAKKLRKKIVILPNSFGPFNGVSVERQIYRALHDVDLIFSRESISSKMLSHLLNRDIPIEKDLGFFLESDKSFNIDDFLDSYNLKKDDKIVGITVRPWRFPTKENPILCYKEYLNSVVSFIEFLIANGYKVALCNQSIGPNSHEDDRNAINEVYKYFTDNIDVVWINENLACSQLKKVYSSFYAFLGTRFHSVIFSITSLVPSIAIGYGGNKALGIMNDLNLGKLQVSIDEVSTKQLISCFNYLVTNRVSIIQRLDQNLFVLKKSRERQLKSIISLMTN